MLNKEQADEIRMMAIKYAERGVVEEARDESDTDSSDMFDDLCDYLDSLTVDADEQRLLDKFALLLDALDALSFRTGDSVEVLIDDLCDGGLFAGYQARFEPIHRRQDEHRAAMHAMTNTGQKIGLYEAPADDGLLHDRIHHDTGAARAAKSVKVGKEKGND